MALGCIKLRYFLSDPKIRVQLGPGVSETETLACESACRHWSMVWQRSVLESVHRDQYRRQYFPTLLLLLQMQFNSYLSAEGTGNVNSGSKVTTFRGQSRGFQKVARPSQKPEPIISFAGLLAALARAGT